jgi:hypothetical protein
MLAAARRSGLFSVWVGWESDSPGTLADYRASGKQGTDRVETIKRMQDHGLEVVLFSVLGGRGDDAGAFERTLELGDRLKVGIHPVLLTPLPGTPLFEQYRPHLLPGLDWDAFTGVRAVFEHPDPAMSPIERERSYHDLCRELYRPSRILRRLSGIPMKAFPGVHLLSLVAQLPMKRALRLAREEWVEKHAPAAAPAAHPGVPSLVGTVRAIRNALAGASATATTAAAAVHLLAEELSTGEAYTRLLTLEEQMEGAGWGLVAAAVAATVVGHFILGRSRSRDSAGQPRQGLLRSWAFDVAMLLAIAAALAVVELH